MDPATETGIVRFWQVSAHFSTIGAATAWCCCNISDCSPACFAKEDTLVSQGQQAGDSRENKSEIVPYRENTKSKANLEQAREEKHLA